MKKRTLSQLTAAALSLFTAFGPVQEVHAQQSKASQWPRGITYEIFVQSFADSNGDGIGDIKGMTSKLDYLKDLGVEAVWLMPMNPSPSYHKYDVTDYYGIHPDYGTMADFKEFISQAHKRNIKVVMDMVLNHSSNQHPWFVDAVKNENSPYRDYYVWTHKNDPQTQKEGRPTGADSDNTQHWHKVEGSDYLYYGYFYDGMPDLNFDSPKLREEVFKIGRFWFTEIGVDGFRLDAARHIFPDERPIDNHNWWVYFRNEMLKANKDVYLVGEVWAPSDIVAPYLKGLPALFNFEMSWNIPKAVNEGRGDSLAIKHAKITNFYQSVNPDFVDATILSNHDQNRIMSTLNNDVNKAKMAASLLLTLPGSPYLYYGEEIGMTGKKPDEQIREPFLWDTKAKDKSRTSWMKPVNTTDETVKSVAAQKKDKNSIYHHYKTLISLRNGSKALTYGSIEPVQLEEKSISAFVRTQGDESVLALHNLSAKEVTVALPNNLSSYTKALYKGKGSQQKGASVTLPAYTSLVLKK
ncbi:alpha-amylase family glycosyl hydrolase [Rufibacter sediminis]|uniref:Alpha-glucosidase C-terminal domain-containing protein n=1 Tax=Rufibacter sediminis TaxID=2762756 RepID=A0ABR6VYQ2_9BACT|nr:alpha-amylase family glycosyl hydrolase [Rufibacter sediminis]MBC3542285.1 alpha-glucosidase C-terminal domain-containing protein [Rufibacter sediminis]